MAPLFSKVDLNKLWHDVQNEETLIYAKFGKDLFNISEVIGRKKWQQFIWLTVYKEADRPKTLRFTSIVTVRQVL